MSKVVTVDVREDIRSGREPYSKIMYAVVQLKPDEQLLLIAPFEPVPLIQVLAKRGFQHSARKMDSGDWEVLFSWTTGETQDSVRAEAKPAEISAPRVAGSAHEVIDVDTRGLEPPQPMVTILEALASLPANAELRARTDRRPMHLYAQLEERGFTGTTQEQPDGSFITHIRRS